MSNKPQSSAPFDPANPLMRDQPLDPPTLDLDETARLGLRGWGWAQDHVPGLSIDRSLMTPDEYLVDVVFGQEGGASKIARDPRPRLFAPRAVSTGGRKTLGSRLIEIGRSARKFLGSAGGRGEGTQP